jgi:hypothetical protein
MSGFERDGPIYRMDFKPRRGEQQLVLEPYAPAPVHQVTLHARIEVENVRYYYVADKLERPKRSQAPEARFERAEVKGSRWVIPIGGLAFTLVQALYKNEMTGQSAVDAMHALFWRYFVEEDDGLKYLNRFAPGSADFYAMNRIHAMGEDDHGSEHKYTNAAIAAIAAAVGTSAAEQPPGMRYWALRACQRALIDRDFADAIEAIVAAREAEEVRHGRIMEFVKTHRGKR